MGKFTFVIYSFVVMRALLLLAFRRRNRLNTVEISFGVSELFDLLDLQASILVGNNMHHEERFEVYINSECGFYLVGDLWGRSKVKLV